MSETLRPHIILITTDQQRYDCLGINGHPELRTPFLDSLAARGLNFRRAYTTCSVCIPARRTLLTGLNSGSHGMNHNIEAAPFDPPATLPETLRQHGYQTQLVGKLHVSVPGVRFGFDNIIQSETPNDRRQTSHQRRNDYADWFEKNTEAPHTLFFGTMSNDRSARPFTLPEYLHHTNWVTEEAARFLTTTRDPSVPFFLHLSYWAPHQPNLPPTCYYDRYADHRWTPAIGDWEGEREWKAGVPLSGMRGPFDQRELHDAARGYFGLINHLDDQLNYLFDRWSCSPLFDRERPVWILFTSDHGEELGDHHLFRKNSPYEGSSHVPMFLAPLRGGKVDNPRSVDALACLDDVAPTLCELAGIPGFSHLGPEDGRSLVPLLRGEENGRETIHGECRWGSEHHRYLISGPFKYIRWTRTGEEQLFNVVADPKEQHDLSGERDLSEFRDLVDAHRRAGCTRDDADVELHPLAGQAPKAIWK